MGGSREKVIAERRAGLFEVLLPEPNRRAFEQFPDFLKAGVKVHLLPIAARWPKSLSAHVGRRGLSVAQ